MLRQRPGAAGNDDAGRCVVATVARNPSIVPPRREQPGLVKRPGRGRIRGRPAAARDVLTGETRDRRAGPIRAVGCAVGASIHSMSGMPVSPATCSGVDWPASHGLRAARASWRKTTSGARSASSAATSGRRRSHSHEKPQIFHIAMRNPCRGRPWEPCRTLEPVTQTGLSNGARNHQRAGAIMTRGSLPYRDPPCAKPGEFEPTDGAWLR